MLSFLLFLFLLFIKTDRMTVWLDFPKPVVGSCGPSPDFSTRGNSPIPGPLRLNPKLREDEKEGHGGWLLTQDRGPDLGRRQFYAMCLLQREDLETKEDRKKAGETAQRTGKIEKENNKEKSLVREEKI